MEPMVKRRAVAEFLGLPEPTLAQMAYKGSGPPYYRIGRYAMYRMTEVVAWVDSKVVEPRPATWTGPRVRRGDG